jgi:hypothetical protein
VDEVLLDMVLARLDTIPLAEEAASLLLAACEGDASLTVQLSGKSPMTIERIGERAAAEPCSASKIRLQGLTWLVTRWAGTR